MKAVRFTPWSNTLDTCYYWRDASGVCMQNGVFVGDAPLPPAEILDEPIGMDLHEQTNENALRTMTVSY